MDVVAQRDDAGSPGGSAQALGALPSSFMGEDTRVDLFPDRVFFLRTQTGEGPLDDIGSWTIAADGHNLALHGGREAPVVLRVEDGALVRPTGERLERMAALPPMEPALPMRGMFVYFADAARFGECLTGRTLPVAMEADYLALERGYLEARREPQEALLATVEGRIALRPKMEGAGDEEALVVDRFVGLWPGETCGPRFATADLENTYWKLTRLGDAAVLVGERQREPHLILRPGERRVGGFGGCNRLVGGYRLDGDALSFGQMAGTLMVCPDDVFVRERAFLDALGRTTRWTIIGTHLELFDTHGALLARFEQRLLP